MVMVVGECCDLEAVPWLRNNREVRFGSEVQTALINNPGSETSNLSSVVTCPEKTIFELPSLEVFQPNIHMVYASLTIQSRVMAASHCLER